MKYHSVKVTLSEKLKNKIQKAILAGMNMITITLPKENLMGDDVLYLTKAQTKKLESARLRTVGVSFKLNKKQLTHETKDELYDIIEINIPDSEKEKIKLLQPKLELKLKHSDLMGNEPLLVTKKQYTNIVKALNTKRGGCIVKMDKNQVEANLNAAVIGGNIWSTAWSFVKGASKKAAAAAPGIAKKAASKAAEVAPEIAKNAATAAAEHLGKKAVDKIVDKIMGEGFHKSNKLSLHLASKDAGNTGLEDEIEKLIKK